MKNRVTDVVLFLFLLPGLAPAQSTRPDEVPYRRMNALGVTTNTNSGLLGGVLLRQTKALVPDKTDRYLSLELVNVKHPKERAYSLGNGNQFILGKQDYLFALRGQWGREWTLFHRSDAGSIQLDGILAGGPTLGLLKPYFVQVVYRRNPFQTLEVPYEPNLERDRNVVIVGGGSLFRGFDQLSVVPGLNVKAAVAIELDAFDRNRIGLETGFLLEAYSREVVIIPEASNRSVFTSGYLTLFFGFQR